MVHTMGMGTHSKTTATSTFALGVPTGRRQLFWWGFSFGPKAQASKFIRWRGLDSKGKEHVYVGLEDNERLPFFQGADSPGNQTDGQWSTLGKDPALVRDQQTFRSKAWIRERRPSLLLRPGATYCDGNLPLASWKRSDTASRPDAISPCQRENVPECPPHLGRRSGYGG